MATITINGVKTQKYNPRFGIDTYSVQGLSLEQYETLLDGLYEKYNFISHKQAAFNDYTCECQGYVICKNVY